MLYGDEIKDGICNSDEEKRYVHRMFMRPHGNPATKLVIPGRLVIDGVVRMVRGMKWHRIVSSSCFGSGIETSYLATRVSYSVDPQKSARN
jgi:hypothetical protein